MTFRIAIIGGQLAGSLVAYYLLEHGISGEEIVIYDGRSCSAGSKATGAIMHPFPAASMKPKEGLFEAYETSIEVLRQFGRHREAKTFRELPMFRPIGGEPTESRLYSSWKSHRSNFPDWLEIESTKRKLRLGPLRLGTEWGLEYGPAFLVDLKELTSYLHHFLRSRGVLIKRSRVDSLHRVTSGWRIWAKNRRRLGYSYRIVLSPGNRLHDWFPEAPIERRGGELLVSKRYPISMDYIYNGGLHGGQKPSGRFVFGSSWWSIDEFSTRSLSAVMSEFSDRSRALSRAIDQVAFQHLWRGVRCTSRDHLPLVGRNYRYENLFVLGGLGGKGLLWGPLCARRLAAIMTTNRETELENSLDIGRVEPENLASSRISE